jgi:predicted kinase
MALGHLRAGAVTLVLVGGLPGTGKNALAGALADHLGFTMLGSDRIRKELAGFPAEQRSAAPWRAGIYTAACTERVYYELSRAGQLLALGESVIVDASLVSPTQRAAAAAAAAAHADLVQLRCTAPAEAVRQRLAARMGGISDADEEIARQMAALDVPWPEAVTIDTGRPAAVPGGPPGAVVRQAIEVIRPHGPEGVRHPARPVLLPG